MVCKHLGQIRSENVGGEGGRGREGVEGGGEEGGDVVDTEGQRS